jgi:hypothetical protein
MQRAPQDNVNFAVLGRRGPIALSTRDLDYDFAGGGRATVGCALGECFQVEGTYTGLAETENSAFVRNSAPNELGLPGNLFSPFGGFGARPVAGLDYNRLVQVRYTSSLYMVELNLRRQLPMAPQRLFVSGSFGVRYVGLPEEFEYQSQSDVPNPLGSQALIRVKTTNDMVGPQIGALFEFYVDNRWWLNTEIKAALLNNHASQTTRYIASGAGAGEYVFSRSEDHTAFAGDVETMVVYRWSPRVAMRIGYRATFFHGLALAADNFPNNPDVLTLGPARLRSRAGSIYHGPFAGVELGW